MKWPAWPSPSTDSNSLPRLPCPPADTDTHPANPQPVTPFAEGETYPPPSAVQQVATQMAQESQAPAMVPSELQAHNKATNRFHRGEIAQLLYSQKHARTAGADHPPTPDSGPHKLQSTRVHTRETTYFHGNVFCLKLCSQHPKQHMLNKYLLIDDRKQNCHGAANRRMTDGQKMS